MVYAYSSSGCGGQFVGSNLRPNSIGSSLHKWRDVVGKKFQSASVIVIVLLLFEEHKEERDSKPFLLSTRTTQRVQKNETEKHCDEFNQLISLLSLDTTTNVGVLYLYILLLLVVHGPTTWAAKQKHRNTQWNDAISLHNNICFGGIVLNMQNVQQEQDEAFKGHAVGIDLHGRRR